MALIKIKNLVIIALLALPVLSWAQSPVNYFDSSKNNQKMENIILIGKIFVPKNSIEEFRNQNVTATFLKTLPGFLKGESYEMLDESGNLNKITITTWLNRESYNNAQNSLKEYYMTIKFNPIIFREKLKIVFENAVYSLHDY